MAEEVAERPDSELLPELDGAASRVQAPRRSPIREVVGIRAYRNYWAASFLTALVNGTLRFAFIWLVITELTTWPPAAGVLGMALGIPALALSLPAGAWADRMDRKLLVIRASVGGGVVLIGTAALIWSGSMTFSLAVVLAVASGVALAVLAPTLQALVPMLVPRERLMSGVALQNIGWQLAMLLGSLVGGAAIALLGTGGAFAVFATLQAGSAVAMSRVEFPANTTLERPPTSMRADIGEGLRFVFRGEPLRTLMILNLVLGTTISVFAINLPELSRRVLGQGAFLTSVLFAAVGLGMTSTSLFLASRQRAKGLGRKLWLVMGFGLGPGIFLMGFSKSYVLTLIVLVLWGMGGGVGMTAHRSLVQMLTQQEMMGRVMGINTLVMLGSAPVGAALTAFLAPVLGPDGVLMAVGAAIPLIVIPLTSRRVIRTA